MIINNFFTESITNDNNGIFTLKKKDYEILGNPEIAERGSGKSSYKRYTDHPTVTL
jgi:hypothetical protein